MLRCFDHEDKSSITLRENILYYSIGETTQISLACLRTLCARDCSRMYYDTSALAGLETKGFRLTEARPSPICAGRTATWYDDLFDRRRSSKKARQRWQICTGAWTFEMN